MSELQAVEPEVLVPLDETEARKLDGRIRRLAKQAGEQLVQVGHLLDAAKAGRIDEALGFTSWTAYVADALGGQLQLSGEARQAMVQLMSGEGMSVRAIASATGVSKSTVARDIDEVSHNGTPADAAEDSDVSHSGTGESDADVSHDGTPASEPATVTGLDNKTYTKPKRKPKPKGDKPAPKRPSARKVIERIAPQFEGMATVVSDLDVTDIDAEELGPQLASIAASWAAINKLIDAVKPTESEGRRQPQIPTVFRDTVKAMHGLARDLTGLPDDKRWPKAAPRFRFGDVTDVDILIQYLTRWRDLLMEVTLTPPDSVERARDRHPKWSQTLGHPSARKAAKEDTPASSEDGQQQVFDEVTSNEGE